MSFTLPPVITDEGAAFLATIIAGQGTINFNSVKYSSTDYTASPQTLTKDNFAGVFATDSTPSASAASPSTISVRTAITNSGIVADTSLYSIGVIADDGNGNSALVCVCVTDTPDVISEDTGIPSTYAYNINLGVSSTENITVTGSVAGALYISDIEDSLTSTATNKALSANQGKALSDAKQNKTLSSSVEGESTVEGALGALSTNKQPKTLSTPITIGGASQTTVEGALNALATNNSGTGAYLKLTDLGTYTADLKADISSGAFEKVKVGGYFTINGHVYYVAHLDYWLHTGVTECTTHHAVVVPASSSLVSGKMNNSNVVTGAYAGSDFKTGANSNTALADIKAIIQADFGSANILTHKEIFANAVDGNGASSGWAWADSDIDLMNETMVYGHCVCSKPGTYGHLYEVGIDKTQLELFAKRPDLITTRGGWWLRDVVASTFFALVDRDGFAYYTNASTSIGIRPAFAIC